MYIEEVKCTYATVVKSVNISALPRSDTWLEERKLRGTLSSL